ncbi:MAG: RHS repeat domain-containing protein, partial [Candidatus Fimenecus sp.]
YTYITKPTETTRDSETRITGSKTEICSGTSEVDVLKAADAFGRTQQTTMILRSTEENEENEEASFAAVVTDYSYKTRNSSTAAGQVDALQARVTYGSSMAAENTVKSYDFAYDYDANGNIIYEYAIGENGVRTVRYHYTYDEANQLTRVDDNVRGKTYVYQYDKGGNRVSEKIYNYTLSNSLGAVQQTIESKYTFLTWKDRLSSYNGNSITYDVAGNPIKYGDTTYVWEGKQLVEIQPGDGSKTQFAYDADGLRTQKRQYGTDGRLEYYVDYVWQNGKLTQQVMTLMAYGTIGNKETITKIRPINTKFVYDGNSDQPVACFVGETQMLFVRNLQGDIIAVVKSDGEVLVEFSYDAWGNVEYTAPDGADEDAQTMAALVALICPLTYRGYNYDFTTGLYYLQSRYYNPEWGRFMNVDDTSILLATQGTSHGANLFAYCENNPVNMVDYTGQNSQVAFAVELVTLLAVLCAIDMACGYKLCDVFPSMLLINSQGKVEKTLDFLDFTYVIKSNQRATIIQVKAVLRASLGITYFEGQFEVRTREDWLFISNGGSLGDSLTKFDDEFWGLSYGLSAVLPSPYLEMFTAFEFLRTVATQGTVDSKRGRYIKKELKRQAENYDVDIASILNWYCTYQKKMFLGRIINVNYIEHDCAKETSYEKSR